MFYSNYSPRSAFMTANDQPTNHQRHNFLGGLTRRSAAGMHAHTSRQMQTQSKVNAAICIVHCHEHVSNALPLPVSRRWSPLASHQPGIQRTLWDHVHELVCHVTRVQDKPHGYYRPLALTESDTWPIKLYHRQWPWSTFKVISDTSVWK